MELKREREVNSGNSQVNAEYLVNILKNFLMTTDTSERAKLVPVLCSILQVSPQDSGAIAQKWRDEAQDAAGIGSGSYVRWLLPSSTVFTMPGSESNDVDPADASNLDLY